MKMVTPSRIPLKNMKITELLVFFVLLMKFATKRKVAELAANSSAP